MRIKKSDVTSLTGSDLNHNNNGEKENNNAEINAISSLLVKDLMKQNIRITDKLPKTTDVNEIAYKKETSLKRVSNL